MDVIFKIFLVTTAFTLVYGNSAEDGFLNIPGEQVFSDPSAPADKTNLQSSQYQDFIRNLYRNDKENLQKFDHLVQSQTAAVADP